MVFHDGSEAKAPLNSGTLMPATLLERVFSFFLDYIILAPVVSFLNLIIFQNEMIIWKSANNSAEVLPLFLNLAAAFILFFSLIQTLFIYYYEATPGQYFLKLKIERTADSGLILLRIFLRQLCFWLSGFLLGIPWLAVMAHPQAKTFYDRLTELSVVSLKTNQKRFHFELETKYWRSLIATFTIFLTALVLITSWKNKSDLQERAFSFDKMQKINNSFCAEMDGVALKQRLQTVIALNLVGQIADVCVDKEADFVLWSSGQASLKSLAYYAKSLTETDQQSEDKYLKQACLDTSSEFLGCRIASAFKNDDIENLYNFFKKSTQAHAIENTLLVSTLKYELALVLNKSTEAHTHFKEIRNFDSQKLVKKYLLSEILTRMDSNSPDSAGQQRRLASEETAAMPVKNDEIKYAKKLMGEL